MTDIYRVWHHGDSPGSAAEHRAMTHKEAARAEFDAIVEGEPCDDDVSRTLLVQRENDREIVKFDVQRTVMVLVMDREVV